MKPQIHFARMLGLLILLLLIMAGASESRAQATVSAELCRQRVNGLEKTITDVQQKLDIKDARIEVRDQKIQAQQEKIDALQEKIADLNSKVGELEKQISTQDTTRALLDNNAQLMQQLAAGRDEALKDRDALIVALVKTSKRSALEKLVEALPSVAGIIALAIAH
ncbi:MAG: hypothetical protein WCD76_00370 [Pyrinomonadaceae bacterium]